MIRLKDSCAAVLVLLMITPLAVAEEPDSSDWNVSLMLDLTATQTAYSDSWVGGEAGSFNWVSNLNGSAERQFSELFNFKSTLKMSFGQIMTQSIDSAGNMNWSKPAKSTDLIDWENVTRLTFGGSVDPFAAVRLETQFQDASVEAKKRPLSPLKLTESAGIARIFYENDADQIMSRLGLALRQIMTSEFINSELETERKTVTDGGLESVTDLRLTLGERLKYTGKLTVYRALFLSNKEEFEGTEFEDDWKSVDINWENIVNASVSKIIAVNFYTQFLYDKQLSRKGRLKQTLGIGFVFRLR